MKSLAIGLILAASLWAAEKNEVDIRTPDGMTLKGTYFSSNKPGPGILLLHQCNMDRHAWDDLAQNLADDGFRVLTVDFRGYGGSVNGNYNNPTQGRAAMREKWPGDVDAAYKFLIDQPGVERSRVAVGGASCGVTQAADLAERHHEIRTLVLLSGSVSPQAKTYIAASPGLAVFGTASKGDSAAAKGIEEALGASKNPHSTLKINPGAEHGVPMFAKRPDLQPEIVSWLKARLASSSGTNNF